MVEAYNTIIVGRVDGVADVRYEVKLHPNGYLVEQPPLTVSTVSVLRVISAPRVKEGQTISFQQAGGPTKDGSSIVVVGDRLVEVGQTYFMFLNDLSFLFGVDEFSGPPFGRFVVGSDRLIIPNGWEGSLGVAAVSGVPFSDMGATFYSDDQDAARATLARRTVDEAAAAILTEIALAPLPPLPTIIPFFAPSDAPAEETPTPLPVESPPPASIPGAAEAPAPTPLASP